MLMPRKVKHRKQQRGRLTGNAKERTLISGVGVEGLLAQRDKAQAAPR